MNATAEVDAMLRRAIESCGRSTSPATVVEVLDAALEALQAAFPDGDRKVDRIKDLARRYHEQQHPLGDGSPFTWQLERALSATGALARAKEVLEQARAEVEDARLGTGRSLPLELHPVVADAAAGLWRDGHRSAAVAAAARVVESQLRDKLGWKGKGTATVLVQEAFSDSDPKPGQRRLRFADVEPGSDAWTNAHQGARDFGKGCFMRLRNPPAHGHELEDRELVEALAAFSLLARWVEESLVEEGAGA